MPSGRLLNLLTALSLLLCVAVVALWVRNWELAGPAGEPARWQGALQLKAPNMRAADQPARVNDLVGYAIDDLEGPGIVAERVQRVGSDGTIALPYLPRMKVVGLTAAEIDAAIFEAYRRVHDYPDRFRVTVATGDWRVSYRLLVLVLAVLPAARLPTAASAVSRRQQKRRLTAGLCARCGYDVRASPSRCPECGSAVATPS
jgi:hypothetical protein